MHEGRRATQRAWPTCRSQNVHELVSKVSANHVLNDNYEESIAHLVVLLVRQVQECVVAESRAGRRCLELAVVLDLLDVETWRGDEDEKRDVQRKRNR